MKLIDLILFSKIKLVKHSNTNITNKIKIKIDIKNLSFFVQPQNLLLNIIKMN